MIKNKQTIKHDKTEIKKCCILQYLFLVTHQPWKETKNKENDLHIKKNCIFQVREFEAKAKINNVLQSKAASLPARLSKSSAVRCNDWKNKRIKQWFDGNMKTPQKSLTPSWQHHWRERTQWIISFWKKKQKN